MYFIYYIFFIFIFIEGVIKVTIFILYHSRCFYLSSFWNDEPIMTFNRPNKDHEVPMGRGISERSYVVYEEMHLWIYDTFEVLCIKKSEKRIRHHWITSLTKVTMSAQCPSGRLTCCPSISHLPNANRFPGRQIPLLSS